MCERRNTTLLISGRRFQLSSTQSLDKRAILENVKTRKHVKSEKSSNQRAETFRQKTQFRAAS
jgi:hypothetical protein